MIEDSEFTNKASHDAGEVLFDSGGTSDCYKLIMGNRAYCIKRPKPDKCHSSEYMALFRKEFELGIDMEHPNIVRYFAYGDDERGPFIRMDFVDSDNLEQFAAKHPGFFSKKENRERLLDELLSALSYLHDKQMLHLDLKPSNILITNKGYHVKLIDLGFAWSESYLYDAGFSRDYCAPEQLENRTDCIGRATDIYALGKVMQQFHLAKDAVVRRCLKENPKERFQSVEELIKAVKPKRSSVWGAIALAVIAGAIAIPISIYNQKANVVTEIQHDTVYLMQYDTVFVAETAPLLTLDDSIAIFKEDLKNALAPTFGFWYNTINDMYDSYSPDMDFYMDKAVSTGRTMIKEKINTINPSKSTRAKYNQAGEAIIRYFMADFNKMKKAAGETKQAETPQISEDGDDFDMKDLEKLKDMEW